MDTRSNTVSLAKRYSQTRTKTHCIQKVLSLVVSLSLLPPTLQPLLCVDTPRGPLRSGCGAAQSFSELEREKKKEEKKKCAASNCRDRHEGNVSRQTWQLGNVPQWSTQACDGLQYAFNGSQQNLTALFL